MEVFFGDRRVRVIKGDITRIPADIIVNAANTELLAGGGVDAAIHRAGGAVIEQELAKIRETAGRCSVGEAVVTRAGDLPAKLVFHTVGPKFREGGQGLDELLASCYTRCLQLAEARGMRIINFPSISTGAYGYPLSEASEIALEAVVQYLRTATTSSVETATFVLFDDRTLDAYEAALRRRSQ